MSADCFSETAPETGIAFGEFLIDAADERVIGPAGPVKLGNKAFRVLTMLAGQKGRLLTKDALFSSVWDGTVVSESSLTSVIKELRRALGDESRTPRYIESVYGRGYRFIAPVKAVNGKAPALAPETATRAPEPGSLPGRSAGEAGRPPLVLVARFQDQAIRDRHPYCAEGLREEVLSGLARVREIQLIADDRSEEEARHGRAADRGYLLSATLIPEGEGVKVIARTKRVADARIVWAETMSLADSGTASGVERIVRRIVGAALPAVDDDLFLGLPRETGDLYDSYLIAKRRSYAPRDFEEAKVAADALKEIIAERPDFGLAYPPLARLYNTDFAYTAFGSTGPEERAYALRLAKDGLAADRASAHAHSLLGFCHLWHGQLALARDCFRHALALNPYNHVRLQEVATAWMFMGDIAGARRLMAEAAEINPNADDNFYEDWGRLHIIEGNYEEALAALGAIVQLSIWAELMIGIAEVAVSHESGMARLDAWRGRVARNWHSGNAPHDDELLRWIRRHKPLREDVAATFFDPLDIWLGGPPASR